MNKANPLFMAVFASQAKVITINNRSSKRMTISLPETSPIITSGESSIEKINTASPKSVLTNVTIKIRAVEANIMGIL